MNLLINLPVGRCKIFDKKTNMNFDFFHDYIENKQWNLSSQQYWLSSFFLFILKEIYLRMRRRKCRPSKRFTSRMTIGTNYRATFLRRLATKTRVFARRSRTIQSSEHVPQPERSTFLPASLGHRWSLPSLISTWAMNRCSKKSSGWNLDKNVTKVTSIFIR